MLLTIRAQLKELGLPLGNAVDEPALRTAYLHAAQARSPPPTPVLDQCRAVRRGFVPCVSVCVSARVHWCTRGPQRWHPDKWPEAERARAAEAFKRVGAAYARLRARLPRGGPGRG